MTRRSQVAESRHDQFDRVYRGVEARPHSWPWIAKIKVSAIVPHIPLFIPPSFVAPLSLIWSSLTPPPLLLPRPSSPPPATRKGCGPVVGLSSQRSKRKFLNIYSPLLSSFVVTARHCVSWDATGEVVEGRRVMLWLGSHGNQVSCRSRRTNIEN